MPIKFTSYENYKLNNIKKIDKIFIKINKMIKIWSIIYLRII